jgi:hypothetical protein
MKRDPSGERTKLPVLANQIFPESAAEWVDFRSFNAGAHAVQETTTRTQNVNHFFIRSLLVIIRLTIGG